MAPTPGKIYSAIEYISKIASYADIKDPVLKDVLKERATVQFGAGMAMSVFNDALVEAMDKKGLYDKIDVFGLDTSGKKDLLKLWLDMGKNALMGNIPGAIIGATSVTVESWNETKKIIASLPSDAPMDPKLRYLYDLTNGAELMKKEKPYLSPILSVGVTTVGIAMAGVEGAKIIAKGAKEFFIPTALAPSDASQLSERNAQQQLTPVNVTFTQTFDGLFTQSADSPGSRYGSHSGTLTDGTRVNVKGDSRPGDFTGSFSGQTVAETGYTPATHNNSAFSGSSVGTVSAKGFKEGDLKGTMTVTVPAGTQTATVSGNITIKTDGSLSMPSYSGPVTVNATSTKVGTMTGEWNQGATR